jgi:hypothetical protein
VHNKVLNRHEPQAREEHVKSPIFPFLAILAISGCAVSDRPQVAQFQTGTTTYSDVLLALGEPDRVFANDDNSKAAYYDGVGMVTEPDAVVTKVLGGADGQTTQVVMVFDARGVLDTAFYNQWMPNAKP